MKKLYETIIQDIERDIREKNIKPGKKLPSVRELCERYKCSKSTVVKAFEVLKSNHIIYSVPQSGYYIVEGINSYDEVSSSIINFSTGNPTVNNLPTPDLKHCLDRAVDIHKDAPLGNSLMGINSLRELIPSYLTNFQVFTSIDNVFINLGIQQALSVLTQMPFPNGKKTILVEEPTYRFFIGFLEFSKVNVIGIERDEKGIDLNRLEDIFKNNDIKFFYTVPRNHNPLGTSYDKTQKKAIARLASKYDVYIVEDDYFGDLDVQVSEDPIYSFGDHYHHIYLKSFSKIIPWIRIGISVIPTHLLNLFREHVGYSYYYSYFSPSLVSQATLEIYIRSKILNKHVNIIKKHHLSRIETLREGFEEFKKYGIKCIGGRSGFYSYIELPDRVNEKIIVEGLKKKGVLVSGGRQYFLSDETYKKGIRLSIARTDEEEIKKGLEIILNDIKNYM
ncbi:PLP-dependent aminotransferase family protein [Fonticella tunisiensis]|uniref:GntR family transcriptional regulator n=1 Tax=Fonticella tunisiensis TaxID=1096341 RepID=A0A4R7KSJ7_9CLOT|nr:PLP-dependent aminotransferase family protein [Fonticella tunisiensis]TDT62738.1 GntR family transcriptional regulator [Fonticella tunisiensis]